MILMPYLGFQNGGGEGKGRDEDWPCADKFQSWVTGTWEFNITFSN